MSEPILINPSDIDPTPAPPWEKPPSETQRLKNLQEVIDFQKRYSKRFELVMNWLNKYGVPLTFERVLREAPNLGNPTQSYVDQSLTFILGSRVSEGHNITLLLRDPEVALNLILRELNLTVPNSFPDWNEPEVPPSAELPCPFDESDKGIYTQSPLRRYPDNDSVNYQLGMRWKNWKLVGPFYSGFVPFYVWEQIG